MEASMEARQQDIIMAGSEHLLANAPTTTTTAAAAASGPTPKVRAGGAPARIFMNENIVPYLLEGMKNVTRDQFSFPISSSLSLNRPTSCAVFSHRYKQKVAEELTERKLFADLQTRSVPSANS
jgi:hypothetical protein